MKYLKILTALLLSVLLLTSCSLTGVGEKGEGANTIEEAVTEPVSDPSKETPSGTAPGLYNANTGELKYSWDELEARGFIKVKETFITDSVNYIRGELYIPNNITGIGKKAFNACTGLVSVYVGNGVTTINDSAFYGCTGLSKVELGSSITNISGKAFGYCTRLSEITIPDSVTFIGASAFLGCTGLQSAHVGDELTYLSKSAFSGCTGLKSVRLGKNLTYIGTSAFNNCKVLSTVKFDGTQSQWNAIFVDKKNTNLTSATLVTKTSPIQATPTDSATETN